MTVTISTFALLMIILVIHTILEHLTNLVIRHLYFSKNESIMIFIVIIALVFRWIFTIRLIKYLIS